MLCNFALHYPKSVAGFLERGKTLRRQFKEESVTDALMFALLTIGGGSIIVDFPDEPSTGADMEWTFVNSDAGTSFQLLLQAKKLHDANADWKQHNYKKLFYKSGPKRTLQAEILCNEAAARGFGTYPIYIFYNPLNSCESANAAGAHNVSGINLCSAHIVYTLAKAKSGRSQSRTLGTLHPFFFSLADVLCPSNVVPLGPMAFSRVAIPLLLSFENGSAVLGRPIPPRPEQVRERLLQQQNSLLEKHNAQGLIQLPPIPPVRDSVPDDIQAILSRFGHPERPKRTPLNYWRVIFVSRNPTDELGSP